MQKYLLKAVYALAMQKDTGTVLLILLDVKRWRFSEFHRLIWTGRFIYRKDCKEVEKKWFLLWAAGGTDCAASNWAARQCPLNDAESSNRGNRPPEFLWYCGDPTAGRLSDSQQYARIAGPPLWHQGGDRRACGVFAAYTPGGESLGGDHRPRKARKAGRPLFLWWWHPACWDSGSITGWQQARTVFLWGK